MADGHGMDATKELRRQASSTSHCNGAGHVGPVMTMANMAWQLTQNAKLCKMSVHQMEKTNTAAVA